ncbi:MAG: hypothetical protein HXY34_00310 [Candidatus Thorarchaeota archaeon]|nr:hypothetical protein [Candidatus Thorarchaeota archaeon]
MYSMTLAMIRNEFRMLFNGLKRTVRTPSMLGFYSVTIVGSYALMRVIGGIVNLGPLTDSLLAFVTEYLPTQSLYLVFGALSAAAVAGGYVGRGPAAVLEAQDEHLLMPSPVLPHQVFLSRYVRRIVRKAVILSLGLFVLSPLARFGQALYSWVLVLVCLVLFLEFNYALGGISSQVRHRLSKRYSTPLRHSVVMLLVAPLVLLSSPDALSNVALQLIVPSNAVVSLLLVQLGMYGYMVGVPALMIFIVEVWVIGLLVLALLCDSHYYEVFSVALSNESSDAAFSRLFRGEVDFSRSRWNDPMLWIVLKDFWIRMRSPAQVWKYISVAVSTLSVAVLFTIQPAWLPPFTVPDTLRGSAVPAFLLMLLVLTQMASMTSMLSFVDEKDNVYLLKSAPFRNMDVVLAKYVGSLVEVSLSALPLYGFLLYFFRVSGSGILIFLGLPLLLVFCSVGVMVGAYVPVFTSNPREPPVPLAFSFPAINLVLGVFIALVSVVFADDPLIYLILPGVTTLIVGVFLLASVLALRSYM